MNNKLLFQKTKTNAINTWRAWNEGNKIFTEYGQIGGKLQITPGTECIATNVGRSNERNPIQQAEFEVDAMYKRQLRLKYSETIEQAQEVRIQVTLALDGHDSKIDFTNGVDVQRKYDGGRTFTIDGERVLYSRGNKIYNVRHITEELNGIKVCWKCKFPIQIRLLISSRCKNHVIGCTCHHCVNMRELNYKKKNGNWIRIFNQNL